MRQAFVCPHCNTHYQIPDEYDGKTIACTKCGKQIEINFEEANQSSATSGDDSLFVPVDESTLLTSKLALKLNYLTREQLKESIQKLHELKSAGEEILFGELLVREGFLSEVQHNHIISIQELNKIRKSDELFGSIITQNKFASK